jgi:aspartate/methionine/tyrosine aminotransferase
LVHIDLSNLPPAPPPEAKVLLLVNPGNPFGDILPDQARLLAWAAQSPHLHVVVDEVYALSNRHGEPFVSMAGRPDADPARVHHLYGLSKDWCMAGVHLGLFWTRNDDLFAQMKDGTRHFRLSSCTKAVLTRLFGDRKLRDEMIEVHRKRLVESENLIVEKLRQAGFRLVQSENSLFVNVEIPECDCQEKEVEYWRQLLTKYGVHVLPGIAGFRMETPGWFRLCFSHPVEYILEGIDRLVKGVAELRKTEPSDLNKPAA